MRVRKTAWMPGLFIVIALALVACGSDPTATAPPAATAIPTAEASSQQATSSLTSEESNYLSEVRRAEQASTAIFRAFGQVISQVYPLRETLIAALIEAGIGTPFVEKTAILESLDPPEAFRKDHQTWLETSRELLQIDTEAAELVQSGDLVEFAILKGKLSGISTAGLVAISPVFCRNIALAPQQASVCAPEGSFFDGKYLVGINDLARKFIPAFATSQGNLGFRLSLTPEELSQVIAATAKDSLDAFQGFYSLAEALAPPTKLEADHERLQEFFRTVTKIITNVERLGSVGDNEDARGELLKMDPAYCGSRASYESQEFKDAVAIIFAEDMNTCGGTPY